ncbi:TIGR00725 family protein, partial [bacterium]
MGIIGVIGGSQVSSEIYRLAYEVGREIGKRGHILVNGGLSGVMEASAKGAKEEGGLVVGILPGHSKESANPWVDIPVVTGMGEARNVII